MCFKNRNKFRIITTLIILACFLLVFPSKAQAEEDVVIVIDPGHGGTNLGAEPGNFYEKEINLITAKAMKEELETFDGVTVYLTREDDRSLSLEERASFAANVNADFLFSLHYNMSQNHYFYGAEVWAQSAGTNYVSGYSFGTILLSDFQNEFGILSRGVKVKVNNRGRDYYGVLRASTELQIPAVIIEHCHLDHQADANYISSAEMFQTFGKKDAIAVAKYFGLSSKVSGLQFKEFQKLVPKTPSTPKIQDHTPPEQCTVTLNSYDASSGILHANVTAEDKDSGILYYSYSLDQGATWSGLGVWPSASNQVSLKAEIKSPTAPYLLVRCFNGYDGMTTSQQIKYY